MFQDLEDLIARLKSSPEVVGILRYGSGRNTDMEIS